jgi:1-deoxy-D-xylulose-5-phosphate reductoisomerase
MKPAVHSTLPQPQGASADITILGSTGTIGCNTLRIISAHPQALRVHTLAAGDNAMQLAQQAREFGAKRAVIANPQAYSALKEALAGSGIEAAAGEEALCEAAMQPVSRVVSAIVGAAGLKPTLAAIRAGQVVALANKESLVCAGELLMREVQESGARLLPVDSEHSGIFQLIAPEDAARWQQVERVTITASGGPFRTLSLQQMERVTPAQAVRHPNWAMGAKISVDSATLMNKGLELIEAYHLFPVSASQLDVLVHPQSIVHALVAMVDGSVLAQLSNPDMCAPIACALAWPQRIETPVARLDLAQLGSLQFEAPDEARFPCLRLAKAALHAGGNAPCVLNAANEVAVQRFLAGALPFTSIAKCVERTLEMVENTSLHSLDEVLACDARARRIAEAN